MDGCVYIGDSIWIRTLIENLSNATLHNVSIRAVTNDMLAMRSSPHQHLATAIAPFATVYVSWQVAAIGVGRAQLNTTLVCDAHPTDTTRDIVHLEEVSGMYYKICLPAYVR